MDKKEKLNELEEMHSRCIYRGYQLTIADETSTGFILNNGDGEPVSKNEDINIKFMLIKDALGFEAIDRATFQKEVNKLDDHLEMKASKLVFYQGWFVRVILEEDDRYLVVSSTSIPEGTDWIRSEKINLKWLLKSETEELQPYVTYWKR